MIPEEPFSTHGHLDFTFRSIDGEPTYLTQFANYFVNQDKSFKAALYGLYGDQNEYDENGDGFAEAGESISYVLTATNDGNVTLYNVNLSDAVFDIYGAVLSGPVESYGSDGVMEVGETFVWEGTYVLTEADIESNFTSEPDVPDGEGGFKNEEFLFENHAVVTAEAVIGGTVTDDDDHEECD